MTKKYVARSVVSISVKLASGKTTHITFTPRTVGGSVFYTDNELIQEGLEKHPKYGKLFKVDDKEGKPATGKAPAGKKAETGKGDSTKPVNTPDAGGEAGGENGADAGGEAGDETETGGGDTETGGGEAETGNGGNTETKTFSCNDDAKQYLVDKFGVSRTKLKNRTEIENAAKENGFTILWSGK